MSRPKVPVPTLPRLAQVRMAFGAWSLGYRRKRAVSLAFWSVHLVTHRAELSSIMAVGGLALPMKTLG